MNRLDDSCFAYQALRKYPIHTKEDALNSYGAYQMQKTAYDTSTRDKIEHQFKVAADFYGIEYPKPPEVKPRDTVLFKGASSNIRLTPAKTKEEVDKLAGMVLEKRASMPRADLAEAAKYVLWAASGTDTDMNTQMYRKIAHIAGIGVGERGKIENELAKRANYMVLDGENRKAFWDFVKEAREMSDEDFMKPANLDRLCDTMDKIDFMYGNQHKRASIGYPEDTVYEQNIDDLVKEASDLFYIPSIDCTLSKKALLEREDAVNGFFDGRYEDFSEPLHGDKLLEKVASLDSQTAEALIENIK